MYHWQLMNVTLPTFVGEWSLAVTDCQLYLQGGYNEPYHPATGAEVIGVTLVSSDDGPRCAASILQISLSTQRNTKPS